VIENTHKKPVSRFVAQSRHMTIVKPAPAEERVPLPKFLKEWNEEDHPRDEAGRFGEGGGGGSIGGATYADAETLRLLGAQVGSSQSQAEQIRASAEKERETARAATSPLTTDKFAVVPNGVVGARLTGAQREALATTFLSDYREAAVGSVDDRVIGALADAVDSAINGGRFSVPSYAAAETVINRLLSKADSLAQSYRDLGGPSGQAHTNLAEKLISELKKDPWVDVTVGPWNVTVEPHKSYKG
jgi:hypothetical protein